MRIAALDGNTNPFFNVTVHGGKCSVAPRRCGKRTRHVEPITLGDRRWRTTLHLHLIQLGGLVGGSGKCYVVGFGLR